MPRRSLSSSTTVEAKKVTGVQSKMVYSFILLSVRFSVTILDDNTTLRMAFVNPLIL